MVRSIHVLTATLMLACLPLISLPVHAQKGGEFIPGSVVSIGPDKPNSKNYKMKMKGTADDAEFDVPITPRTALLVTAKGDAGFLRKDVIILVKALKGATEFSGKDFTVFLGAGPQPHLTVDPLVKEVFEICGKVLANEEGVLMVQCGPQPQKLAIEAGATVTLKLNNPALIKEGDTVEVDGTLIKSKKQLNAKTINVTSAAELKSDEYFAALDEKKSKTSRTKTTAKTKTEGTDAGAAAAAGAESADPFGVLKGKKATTPKAEKGKEGDTKKEDAKKEEPKKEGTAKEDAKPAASEKTEKKE